MTKSSPLVKPQVGRASTDSRNLVRQKLLFSRVDIHQDCSFKYAFRLPHRVIQGRLSTPKNPPSIVRHPIWVNPACLSVIQTRQHLRMPLTSLQRHFIPKLTKRGFFREERLLLQLFSKGCHSQTKLAVPRARIPRPENMISFRGGLGGTPLGSWHSIPKSRVRQIPIQRDLLGFTRRKPLSAPTPDKNTKVVFAIRLARGAVPELAHSKTACSRCSSAGVMGIAPLPTCELL